MFILSNKNANSKLLPAILLLVSVLFLSALSGIIAAFGSIHFFIALLALYGVFFILITPVAWIVWIIFWLAFLISGPSAYFFRFTQIQWVTVLVSAALLIPVLLHLLHNRNNIRQAQISTDIFWPAVFLLLVIFSTLIDNPQFADFVNASRHYFLMWPLMLVIMLGMIREEMLIQLWKAVVIVAILQFPMALYQYFFVARKSIRGDSPWDAVIGTFHGNIEGGGDSVAMAIMLLIAMLTAIALWRGDKLRNVWMVLVILTGLGTLALAEVKAAVMLLPVVLGLYYRSEILRRPIESLVIVIGSLLLVVGLLIAYEEIHYGESSTHTFKKNQVTSIYDRISRAIDPETESYQGGQLGRVNHLIKWWDINVKSGDWHHSLFGYGMGATHASKVGVGELADRFPYPVNKTATNILLWETGILGHLAFIFILLSGALISGHVAQSKAIPEIHRILLRVGEIGLLLLTITLLYKNFHFYSNPIQFLMMLMLGQAAFWSRFLRNNQEKS